MPRLVWDKTGERLYETGVKMGVFYPQDETGAYKDGEAWNGLSAVTESPSGAEATPIYANDSKYLNLYSVEELGGSIEAYTYPDGFAACNGEAELEVGVTIGQQNRKAFGLSYRTTLGNDVKGTDFGYKLHLIYNMQVSPSEKAYQTINDSPEAMTMSWEFTTTPVTVDGFKPTASLTIDSTKVDPTKLKKLEDVLYGNTEAAKLPLPNEVVDLLKAGE